MVGLPSRRVVHMPDAEESAKELAHLTIGCPETHLEQVARAVGGTAEAPLSGHESGEERGKRVSIRRTVVVTSAQHPAADGFLTSRHRARRRPLAIPVGMSKVVGEQTISPLLKLPPLRAGEEIRLRERDRRASVRPDRVDPKHARRLPMTAGAPIVLDGAEAEERAQRPKESQVASRHRHGEDELRARCPVAVRTALTDGGEGPLGGNQAAKREANRVPRLEERWKKLGGGEGIRTLGSSCMPCRRSTRLSYAPGGDNGTSAHLRLELITPRTHVCIMTWGYDIYP